LVAIPLCEDVAEQTLIELSRMMKGVVTALVFLVNVYSCGNHELVRSRGCSEWRERERERERDPYRRHVR